VKDKSVRALAERGTAERARRSWSSPTARPGQARAAGPRHPV